MPRNRPAFFLYYNMQAGMLLCYCAQRLSCGPMESNHQDPLSMGFFRQEYWEPFPSPRNLLDSGIEPISLKSPC